MRYSITVLAFHHNLSAFLISYNIFHCYGEAVQLDTCLRMEHHGLACSTAAYSIQHRDWHQGTGIATTNFKIADKCFNVLTFVSVLILYTFNGVWKWLIQCLR